MLRRSFLILIIIASVAVIAYTLWSGDQERDRVDTLLMHIGDDAALVLEVDDAERFHERLSRGNVIWPDLMSIAAFSSLQAELEWLQTLGSKTSNADSSYTYTLSLHPSGQRDMAWLLAMPLRSSTGALKTLLNETGATISTERAYDGHTIYTLTSATGERFACVERDVVYISESALCLERHLRLGEDHLANNQSFNKSYRTRSRSRAAHLHLNAAAYSSQLRSMLPKSSHPLSSEDFAGWSTTDFLSDANTYYLNGLISASDTLGHVLERFRNQGTSPFTPLLELAPVQTSDLTYYSVTDLDLWSGESLSWLSSIGEGLLSAHLEIDADSPSKAYTITPLQDATALTAYLDSSYTSGEPLLGEATWTCEAGFLEKLYGPALHLPESEVLCIYNGYLITCDRTSTLSDILLAIRSGRTLAHDEHFSSLIRDMDDEASICYYLNIARSLGAMAQEIRSDLSDALLSTPDTLRHFQALVMQYEPASDGLFHQNIMLRHNPIYKRETSSIWEAGIDTTDLPSMQWVTNHYSKQLELLALDNDAYLHLIDNAGKTLWSYAVEESISSDINQVDLLRNDKLQLIFSTPTRIIALDRKGRMVDGYPVMLPDTASSPLSVIDYDGKRKYRLLIGTQDGRLHNYDSKGQPVKGWEYKAQSSPIIGHIEHFIISGKDYVTTVSADGDLRFLERSGKVRFGNEAHRLAGYAGGPYSILKGKNVKETRILYTDDSGQVLIKQVDGPSEELALRARYSPVRPRSTYQNTNGDLDLYDLNGEELLHIEHGFEAGEAEMVSKAFVGVADPETGLYYLYDSQGELVDGFPLPGRHAIMGDVNLDNVMDVLLEDRGRVSMFSL